MIHLELFRKASVAFVILAVLAGAQDKGTVNPASPKAPASSESQTLLQRAADATDLAAAGQIFKISGTVAMPGAEGVTAQGTWMMLVAAEEKTYINMSFPDYRRSIWTHDQIAWHQESAQPAASSVRQFEALLRFRERLLAAYPQARYKTTEQTIEKVKRTCAAVSQKDRTMKLCVDETSGVPLSLNDGGAIYRFSDYKTIANRQFPLTLGVNSENGSVLAAVVVRTIEIASAEDAKLLSPPAELAPVAGLKCIAGTWQQHIRRSPYPEFPAVAKTARVQGQVVLEFHINEHGGVEHVEVLKGHPMLAPSARDAIRQWQFEPFVCDGKAVGVDEIYTVSFNLTGVGGEMP
jgi:TonB family protein